MRLDDKTSLAIGFVCSEYDRQKFCYSFLLLDDQSCVVGLDEVR